MRRMFTGKRTRNKKMLLCSCIFLIVSFLLTFFARESAVFSQWYAENITPLFVNSLGRLFSHIPFSLFELLLVIGLLFVIGFTVFFFSLLIHNRPKAKKYLAGFLSTAIFILSFMLLLFNLTASINYNRLPLNASYGTSVREYSDKELLGLTMLLIDDLAAISDSVQRDERNMLRLDDVGLSKNASDAMKSLSERFPSLSGYYPNPKPVHFSKPMSYMGITGIFSPFTIEANYNKDIPSYSIPYTICHELAHLKGFMREDEAGFLAYLACVNSESHEFKYSGTLNALQYTLNQLYKNIDSDTYDAVYMRIPESVRNEISLSRAYWKSHTVSFTSVAKTANDKYLAANAQTHGTKSYGMMVDLLLKEYESKIVNEYSDLTYF